MAREKTMRSEGDFIRINEWLTPISFLYGIVIWVRNRLFDLGILKSRSYDIPVISVGNITVGGTGKTPHVEYLVNLLQKKSQVGILSRGYKRKSHGYVLADDETPMQKIGDEPYQMKQKFPKAYVAVDKKRTRGIDRLCSDEETSDVDVIVLDDAFQHRYVTPGINILLIDYHRLIIYDKLLPAGRLREPKDGKNRADIVIVTKCPRDLKPMEYRVMTRALNLYPYQALYFTTLDYQPLRSMFRETRVTKHFDELHDTNVLLLTGIASPKQLVFDLKAHVNDITPLAFADHHQFSPKDIERINQTFNDMPSPKMIVTTEKDQTRLQHAEGLDEEVRQSMFVLPVAVKFMLDREENFNEKIISYVQKNSRNSVLVKTKDDHKPKDSNHSGDRPRTISFRNN